MVIRKKRIQDKLLIGWREWCALPSLGLPALKAKIDTGAKTSSLHAFDISDYHRRGKHYVKFFIHPMQRNNLMTVECHAPIVDQRNVMSSNGHVEARYVILTNLEIGMESWEIEMTLSNRDPLRFRMLLGREALKGHVLIDPMSNYRQGNLTRKQMRELYRLQGNVL